MKLTVDTTNKTITIDISIVFKDLIDALNEMFPNDTWKEFTLITYTQSNFAYPIIIREREPYRYPWWQPYYDVNTPVYQYDNSKLQSGIYNVEF